MVKRKANFRRRECPTNSKAELADLNRQAPVFFLINTGRASLMPKQSVSRSRLSLIRNRVCHGFFRGGSASPVGNSERRPLHGVVFKIFFRAAFTRNSFIRGGSASPVGNSGIETFAWGLFFEIFFGQPQGCTPTAVVGFLYLQGTPRSCGSGTHKIPTKSGIGRRPCRAAEVRSNSTIV